MTSLADRVLENVSSECITNLCDRDDCSIDLTGSPKPYTLVDLDHPQGPAKRKLRMYFPTCHSEQSEESRLGQ